MPRFQPPSGHSPNKNPLTIGHWACSKSPARTAAPWLPRPASQQSRQATETSGWWSVPVSSVSSAISIALRIPFSYHLPAPGEPYIDARRGRGLPYHDTRSLFSQSELLAKSSTSHLSSINTPPKFQLSFLHCQPFQPAPAFCPVPSSFVPCHSWGPALTKVAQLP